MATRFVRSGSLLFCYGCPEAPEIKPAKKPDKVHPRIGLWVALLIFGMLFFTSLVG